MLPNRRHFYPQHSARLMAELEWPSRGERRGNRQRILPTRKSGARVQYKAAMFRPLFQNRVPKLFATRRPRLGHAASVFGRANHEREPARSWSHFGASPHQGFTPGKKAQIR